MKHNRAFRYTSPWNISAYAILNFQMILPPKDRPL